MTAVTTALLALAACGRGSGGEEAAPAPGPSPTPYHERTASVARLSPVQISKHLARTTGLTMVFTSNGYSFDLVSDVLGVTLGGVDFSTVSEYDPFPKVQSLMALRVLAWNAAGLLVVNALKGKRDVFPGPDLVLVSPKVDRTRWKEVLTELYLRLYSRPPSKEEADAVEATFRRVADNEEGNAAAAWLMVTYALLCTGEFWNI